MRKFMYTISTSDGIHTRHAGELVKFARDMNSVIRIQKGSGEFVSLTRPIALVSQDIRQGDRVTVSVEGGRENANANALIDFFEKKL